MNHTPTEAALYSLHTVAKDTQLTLGWAMDNISVNASAQRGTDPERDEAALQTTYPPRATDSLDVGTRENQSYDTLDPKGAKLGRRWHLRTTDAAIGGIRGYSRIR